MWLSVAATAAAVAALAAMPMPFEMAWNIQIQHHDIFRVFRCTEKHRKTDKKKWVHLVFGFEIEKKSRENERWLTFFSFVIRRRRGVQYANMCDNNASPRLAVYIFYTFNFIISV